jgi:hypothetical protein
MRKSRRALVLFAMPLLVIIWWMGWGLYWIGKRKEKLKPDLLNVKENVTLTVLLPKRTLKT